jgi:hypothetical protein
MGETIAFVGDRTARERLAASWADAGVADAYRHRPPCPAEVVDLLELIITSPGAASPRSISSDDRDIGVRPPGDTRIVSSS